jgi:hypothetical protein
MLNRALYALENAWHVRFKAAALNATAVLPCGEGLNDLFFSTVERNVRALTRRGMHRTALEWAKFVLSLDHSDPCGMLFHIDYLALRSRQYVSWTHSLLPILDEVVCWLDWPIRLLLCHVLQRADSKIMFRPSLSCCRYCYLDELMSVFQGPVPLRMLPNYAFSSAMAAYYESKESRGPSHQTATRVHESGTKPALDAKLVNAILTFPTALVVLIKAMQGKVRGHAKDIFAR